MSVVESLSCQELVELVTDYLEGALSEEDVQRFEAHLETCVGCTVYVSIPSVDEESWRTLEPGVAPPIQRLRALRELVDAGIHAGVLMAPIVPGFTSSRRNTRNSPDCTRRPDATSP